jgi:hypothetical protein
MKLTDIKIQLFDTCHDLVQEYMWTNAPQIKNESIEEYHNRYGKIITQIWEELSKGKLN